MKKKGEMMNKQSNHQAFTLIELLIVVLIIAILAAIAIPNFLEFQTRAKVSRAKADLRSIATGLEAYCVDEGEYPAPDWNTALAIHAGLYRLTTPIAYMTSIPRDSFGEREETLGGRKVNFFEYGGDKSHWVLESCGPDLFEDTYSLVFTTNYPWGLSLGDTAEHTAVAVGLIYDPTNGTVSAGQIFRAGGDIPPTLSVRKWFELVSR
jgi:type II secretion system protein G